MGNAGGLDKTAVSMHSQSMRTGLVILFNLLAMASIAIADETLPELKAGNQTYTHVTIFKLSATDIYFTSDKGIGQREIEGPHP